MQKVLGSYILLKEIKADHKESMTGLITTASDTAKMRYHEAVVFAKGPVVKYVEVDDKIMYDMAQGHHITVEDVTYRIIQERDVALVL